MKRFLCYLLITSMLIVSCVGCNKETKETDKKETKVEKTDTQEEVSDNKQETENEVVTDTKESSTSNETSSNTKKQTSTKQENTKSTTTKQSTSQSNKEETTQNNGSKHKHTYSTAVTQPTCTEQGFTTYTCSCGDSYKNDFTAAKGHTEVIDKAVAATTTSTGLTEGKHCSVCNTVIVKQEVVDKIIEYFYTKDINVAWNYKTGSTYSGGGVAGAYCDYQIVSASCTPQRASYIADASYNTTCLFTLKIQVKCMTALRYMKVPYVIKDSNGNVIEQNYILDSYSSTASYTKGVTYTISTKVNFPLTAGTYTITLGSN